MVGAVVASSLVGALQRLPGYAIAGDSSCGRLRQLNCKPVHACSQWSGLQHQHSGRLFYLLYEGVAGILRISDAASSHPVATLSENWFQI